MQRSRFVNSATALMFAVPLVCAPAIAAAQTPANVDARSAEAVHEHLDEAEDLTNSLVEWRHVLSNVTRQGNDTRNLQRPATTLITVDKADVEQLAKLIDAAANTLPKAAQTQSRAQAQAASRGDLQAHIQKAQEIVHEMMPASAGTAAGTVGTSGRNDASQVTIDRTALKRLQIELEAAEQVAPRTLK